MNDLLKISGVEILSKEAQKQVTGGFGDPGIFDICDNNDPGIGDQCFPNVDSCAQNQVCVLDSPTQGVCSCGETGGTGLDWYLG